MRRHVKFTLASGASIAAGLLLGASFSNSDSAEDRESLAPDYLNRPVTTLSKTVEESDAENPDLRMRRLVARCETKALWDWLLAAPLEDAKWRDVVVTELVDRLGWQALDTAMEIDPDRERGTLSEHVLSKLGERDPWKAYDFWKARRAEFENPQWGSGALDWTITAGSAASAEKLIEVLQQMTDQESQTLINVEFSRGFDFRSVLDHLAATDKQPLTVPANLLPEWAKQSPVEAATWLLEHPEFRRFEYIENEANGLLNEIAGGKGPAELRRQALDQLAAMQGDYLDKAWKGVVARSEGKVDAEILDSAAHMNRRDTYLAGALLETRTFDGLDSSWNSVPLEERRTALRNAELKWRETQLTPVQARALERWKTMATTAWGINP
jgi:hypothetical protein